MAAIAFTTAGIERLRLPMEQRRFDPLAQAMVAALNQELDALRAQNDHPQTIGEITYRQGGIAMLKRILAQLEVGPESRESEGQSPESPFADGPVGPLDGE